jgi:hypothetical protein
MLSLLLSGFSLEAQDKKAKTSVSKKIEVYYFHYTRRCITCNAVEQVTKDAIAAMYPEQFNKGQIIFKSINLDEKGNEALAKKCKADGSSLILMTKGKQVNLTDKAFMYAKNSPEKLKAEIKKVLDSML